MAVFVSKKLESGTFCIIFFAKNRYSYVQHSELCEVLGARVACILPRQEHMLLTPLARYQSRQCYERNDNGVLAPTISNILRGLSTTKVQVQQQ